jgi:hypothetical protein
VSLVSLTSNEKLALAACAILIACIDDNLRNLSATERVVALQGRDRAGTMLAATKITPTELKDLGTRMCSDRSA